MFYVQTAASLVRRGADCCQVMCCQTDWYVQVQLRTWGMPNFVVLKSGIV